MASPAQLEAIPGHARNREALRPVPSQVAKMRHLCEKLAMRLQPIIQSSGASRSRYPGVKGCGRLRVENSALDLSTRGQGWRHAPRSRAAACASEGLAR